MKKNSLEKKLIKVLYNSNIIENRNYTIEEVKTLLIDNINIDSYQYVSLVVDLEEEFGIEMTEELLSNNVLENIDILVAYLEKEVVL